MKEQLISFQTALLAKKNHLEIESYEFYTHRGDLCHSEVYENQSNYDGSYGAFTLSLLQKWFREKHNICVEVYSTAYGFIWCLVKADSGTDIKYSDDSGPNAGGAWDSYEEALEKGLQEAFKYINK